MNKECQRKSLIIKDVIQILNISKDDETRTTKSGLNVIYDRTTWACVYLLRAGMIGRPQRGVYKITELGVKIFNNENQIDNKIIAKYCSDFSKFQYIAGQTKWNDWINLK